MPSAEPCWLGGWLPWWFVAVWRGWLAMSLVGWLVVMALWFCDRLAIAGKGRLAVKMPGWVNDCLIPRVLGWLYN